MPTLVQYLHSHYWRAVRTAIQTFAAVIVAAWLSNGSSHGITALLDALRGNWNNAAGTAFLSFLAALGWKPGLVGGKGDPADPALPATHPLKGTP